MIKSDKKDKQGMILVAAAKIFAQKGYHRTTIEDIAREAGIGKSTVYEYFSSKEDVIRSILDRGSSYYYEFLSEAQKGMESTADKLSSLIGCWLVFATTHPDLSMICNIFMFDYSMRELAEYFKENVIELLAKPIREVLEEAKAKGELRIDDMELAVSMISGMIMGVSHQIVSRKVDTGAEDEDCDIFSKMSSIDGAAEFAKIRELVATLIDAIWYGLKVRA